MDKIWDISYILFTKSNHNSRFFAQIILLYSWTLRKILIKRNFLGNAHDQFVPKTIDSFEREREYENSKLTVEKQTVIKNNMSF